MEAGCEIVGWIRKLVHTVGTTVNAASDSYKMTYNSSYVLGIRGTSLITETVGHNLKVSC